MSFVVDSSVALSWCFEDERTPASQALLDRDCDAGAHAPQLWPLRVINGLIMAEHRRRLDADRRRVLAAFLHELPIALHPDTAAQAWRASQAVAERFRLTAYDAAYLELAHRKRLPLATLDQALGRAATGLNVTVLGSSTS